VGLDLGLGKDPSSQMGSITEQEIAVADPRANEFEPRPPRAQPVSATDPGKAGPIDLRRRHQREGHGGLAQTGP